MTTIDNERQKRGKSCFFYQSGGWDTQPGVSDYQEGGTAVNIYGDPVHRVSVVPDL
ncbi:MAG: hypothetical protein ABIG61_16285 [Planctomycetota bacterium]